MRNVTVFVMKNETAEFTIPFVTKLSVGHKLIYIEYQEDGQRRIRAFGRAEFDAVQVDDETGEVVAFPLKDENFEKISSRFDVGDDTTDSSTDAEDAIPEEE